jgi:hypothetical protein
MAVPLPAMAGVTPLRLCDERLSFTRAAASANEDRQRAASVQHGMHELLAQRVYGLCCGREDVSDHNVLRRDLVWQTAVGRAEELSSAATFSRLENCASARDVWALHGVLADLEDLGLQELAGKFAYELCEGAKKAHEAGSLTVPVLSGGRVGHGAVDRRGRQRHRFAGDRARAIRTKDAAGLFSPQPKAIATAAEVAD